MGQANESRELAVSSISPRDADYRPIPLLATWLERTTVDTALWSRYIDALSARREAASPAAVRDAVQRAMRRAAVDTGAIEGLYEVDRGFTESVAALTASWDVAFSEKGPDAAALFAAQMEAFELVLDAATNSMPVTEAWIRRLHEVLCAPQRTYRVNTPQGPQEQLLPKGVYKSYPNHVILPDGSHHAYAPVALTAPEMGRLVQELRTDAFTVAHPVHQASFAHFAFVTIHPFADGNGRVARALASFPLYRHASTPLVIFADQKADYFDALRSADEGDYQPFVEFILDRAIDSIGAISDSIRRASNPSGPTLQRLLGTHTGVGDLTIQETDSTAKRLLSHLLSEFQSQISNLQLPPGVTATVDHVSGAFHTALAPQQYREVIESPTYIRPLFRSASPATAEASTSIQVVVSRFADERFAFVVERQGTDDLLEVRLSDVHPEIRTSLRARITDWTACAIADCLQSLETTAAESRKSAGY